METIHISTLIHADTQKVWHTMLDDATYRQWTAAFNEGSYYEGDWTEGSEIRFVGANAEGQLEGMYSHVKENTKYHFLSILHMGIIKNGQVDTTSDEVKKWAPSYENYTFLDKGDGTTELVVDMQIEKSYKAMFEEMWAKALKLLKEICEQ